MSDNTKIEWADHTWSPWIGCQKVSPGCDHCYAEALNKRTGGGNWGPDAPRRRTGNDYWRKPYRWNTRSPGSVFPSMCDPFDNAVPEEWRRDFGWLIRETPNLTWLLLTKRIGNAPEMIPHMFGGEIPPNMWVGATLVNRDEMLRDGPKLRQIPARVRFWSVEPMLGDFGEIPGWLLPEWVICGGESGPGARPMHPSWARSLRDQCHAAGVPFHFKQIGEWGWIDREQHHQEYAAACNGEAPWPGDRLLDADGTLLPGTSMDVGSRQHVRRIGKKRAGRLLDGREHSEFPA